MSKLAVFLANGMEEVECLAVVDVARRAGVDVRMVSVTGDLSVTGSHGITVRADQLFEADACRGADALYLPGGLPGTTNLGAHEGVCALAREFAAQGKHVAALCAAPSVLGRLGLLRGKRATCYPGFEDALEGAKNTRDGVVTDGNVTTGRGLGFAVDLGLELVRVLEGEAKALDVKQRIQHPDC